MEGSTNHHKPYLLLVHGALADERMWREHIGLLQGEYRVQAVTLGHFGKDPDSDSVPFGLNSHADELAAYALNLASGEPVHVAAWSYGADVALNAAVRHPGRFASLLLYEPGYPGCLRPEEMNAFGRDARDMFDQVYALEAEGSITQAVKALVDKSAKRVGYFMAQPEELRTQQLENAHTLRYQLHQQETPDLSVGSLEQLDIPVTVAWGAETRVLFLAVCVGVAEVVPLSRIVSVDGAGHMLPLEDPRRFVELIREHLAG